MRPMVFFIVSVQRSRCFLYTALLWSAFGVLVHSAYMVHTVLLVHSAYMVHTVLLVHLAHMVHMMFLVFLVHMLHMMFLVFLVFLVHMLHIVFIVIKPFKFRKSPRFYELSVQITLYVHK